MVEGYKGRMIDKRTGWEGSTVEAAVCMQKVEDKAVDRRGEKRIETGGMELDATACETPVSTV